MLPAGFTVSIRLVICGLRCDALKGQQMTFGPFSEGDTTVSASELLTACDSMLRELEQTVQASDAFIQKFKMLAEKLDLPSRHAAFESLARAESLLLRRLEAARDLANKLGNTAEPAEQERAREEIAATLRQVRRARLFVQLKIFRLDTVLEPTVRKLRQV